ncbi:hypothetical protein ABFS82_12G148800 [Erythranthe guttata]
MFGGVLNSIHHHFRDHREIDFLDGLHSLKKHCTTTVHESKEENRFNVKGHELLENFVSNKNIPIPIKRLIRENLHDFGGKPAAASDNLEKLIGKSEAGGEKDKTTSDRGVSEDMFTSEWEEEQRLERFRVKTVNVIGLGVVKEEGQQ